MITLKTVARAAMMGAVLSIATASMAAAAPTAPVAQSNDGYNRQVVIHNNTGWTMTHFYASDSRLTDWQEDILGSSVLPNGNSVRINIDDGNGGCVYDFKARFSNGQELTRMRINVCQIADYYYTR